MQMLNLALVPYIEIICRYNQDTFLDNIKKSETKNILSALPPDLAASSKKNICRL